MRVKQDNHDVIKSGTCSSRWKLV